MKQATKITTNQTPVETTTPEIRSPKPQEIHAYLIGQLACLSHQIEEVPK